MPNFSSAVPLVDPVYRNALQLLKEAREGNQVGARAQDPVSQALLSVPDFTSRARYKNLGARFIWSKPDTVAVHESTSPFSDVQSFQLGGIWTLWYLKWLPFLLSRDQKARRFFSRMLNHFLQR
jgi:hypothetical protein